MTDFPKLLTPKELATIFRCDKSTISNWIRDGTIPPEFVFRPSGCKKGSKILIDEKAIKAMLEPPPVEHVNLKHYKSQRVEEDSYKKLLSRF